MAMGALAQHLPEGDYEIATAPRDFQAGLVATAWGLGVYAFDRYKKRCDEVSAKGYEGFSLSRHETVGA